MQRSRRWGQWRDGEHCRHLSGRQSRTRRSEAEYRPPILGRTHKSQVKIVLQSCADRSGDFQTKIIFCPGFLLVRGRANFGGEVAAPDDEEQSYFVEHRGWWQDETAIKRRMTRWRGQMWKAGTVKDGGREERREEGDWE